MPGEGVDFRITLTDDEGKRLHALGSLPTYSDFVHDAVPSGLRYYDGFREVLQLYYALKHREENALFNLAGPSHKLHFKAGGSVVPIGDLFLPQATFASVSVDGYTSLAQLVPPGPQQIDPTLQGRPVSDVVHFTIPNDAERGTYVATLKWRRDFAGEAANRTGQAEIQVGEAARATWVARVGNCQTCHSKRSDLVQILHGDVPYGPRCQSCHAQLGFEPDHALDYRVHFIHSRSERVAADVNNCSLCHFSTPTGNPRGFPGFNLP